MAVDANALSQAIIAAFPSDFNYDPLDRDGKPQIQRQWLDSMSGGFIPMWTAGTMTPGTGPPPPGSFPHIHTLLILVPATMSTPPATFLPGLGGISGLYIGAIAAAVSEYLIANTTTSLVDGAVSHKHLFLSFGVGTGMRDLMLTKIRALAPVTVQVGGETITVDINPDAEGSRVSDWCLGVSNGIINHLTAAADMTLAVGSVHVHLLL